MVRQLKKKTKQKQGVISDWIIYYQPYTDRKFKIYMERLHVQLSYTGVYAEVLVGPYLTLFHTFSIICVEQ